MKDRLMQKLGNNQTPPQIPQQSRPQKEQTSTQTLFWLMELIAHSESKAELLKNLAKMKQPVLLLIVGMIETDRYQNARPHLITLLAEMSENERILQAMDGIQNA